MDKNTLYKTIIQNVKYCFTNIQKYHYEGKDAIRQNNYNANNSPYK